MARRRSPASNLMSASQPTTRTQYTERAVPQEVSPRAGLEGVSEAFQNFFGQVQLAADDVKDTMVAAEKQKIREENQAQKAQATSDFFSGSGVDPSLKDDDDYIKQYKSLKAARVANDASREFMEFYRDDFLPNNPQGDLDAARREWAESNLSGFSDPEVQASVYGQFFNNTDTMVQSHLENSFKWKTQQDLQEQRALINEDVANDQIDPERIQWHIDLAKQIDPMNPNEAAPRVVASLMSSVRNNPSKTNKVIHALQADGTGINGKSFAESFPDAFADFQSGALKSYMQTNTKAEQEFVDRIDNRLNDPEPLTDDEVTDLTSQMASGEYFYGAGRDINKLRQKLARRLEETAQDRVELARVENMIGGGPITDAGLLRSRYGDYMETRYGTRNVLEVDPAVLARDLDGMGGVVPEEVKVQLSNAITNGNNLDTQVKAAQVLAALQSSRGDDFAANVLSSEASRYYENVKDRLPSGDPLPEILSRVNESRKNADISEVEWTHVLDLESPAEAEAEALDRAYDAVQTYYQRNNVLSGAFTDDVNIPGNVRRAIADYALRVAAERGTEGVEPDEAFKEAAKAILPNASVVGEANDPYLTLSTRTDKITPEGDPVVPLGYAVPVPGSGGKRVNTREIFLEDLESVAADMPWLFKGPDTSEVAVQSSNIPGTYQVLNEDGSPVKIKAGETFTWKGQEITIPEDAADMAQMFRNVEAGGFTWREAPATGGTGWQLMYQPHYGPEPTNLKDKADEFERSQSGSDRPNRGHPWGNRRSSEVPTQDEILNDMLEDIVENQRDSGNLMATSGVTQELPEIGSGEDIINYLVDNMHEGVRKNGRRFVGRNSDGFYEEGYRDRRWSILSKEQPMRRHAVDSRTGKRVSSTNPKGDVIVGMGFNMSRKGAKEIFETALGSDVSFEDVKQGKTALTDTQIKTLFDIDLRVAEDRVRQVAGDVKMPEQRHLALVSIAQRDPSLLTKLDGEIGKASPIEIGRDILFEGLPEGQDANPQERVNRYLEAARYLGPDLKDQLPPVDEYLEGTAEVSYSLEGKTRDRPVSSEFEIKVSKIAGSMGDDIGLVVTSAGQDPAGTPNAERTGSTRHDVDEHGVAHTADFVLTKGGEKVLPGENPRLYEEFIERAAAAGFTGIGHYAWGIHVGDGRPAFWGPDTTSDTASPRFAAAYRRGRIRAN